MNILHLITSMDKGGAENHLAVLSKAQKKSGNNIHIIYLKGNDYNGKRSPVSRNYNTQESFTQRLEAIESVKSL